MHVPARVALPVVLALVACGPGTPSADSAGGVTAAANGTTTAVAPALVPSDTAVRGASASAAARTLAGGAPALSATPAQRPAAAAAAPAAAAPTPSPAAAPAQKPAQKPPQKPAEQPATQPATKPAAPAERPAPVAPAAEPVVSPPAAAPAQESAPRTFPFSAGERLEYQVKYGFLGVGRASMEVVGSEEVRGTQALHIVFQVRGGITLYSVNDRYESWFDARTLSSLRFAAKIDEGSYERDRRFEIFPERQTYSENGGPEQPSVAQPLDDGSFIYFVRDFLQHTTVEIGKEYSFERYFRPDRNPVRLRILRRERVKVPAGTFDAIVVQPIIKTTGIFGEGGKAQLWFTDDSTRTMVQMKSSLKFGSLNLYLTKRTPGS